MKGGIILAINSADMELVMLNLCVSLARLQVVFKRQSVVHGARLKSIIKRLYKGECSRKWEGLVGSPRTSSHAHYLEPAPLEELPCGFRVSDLGRSPCAENQFFLTIDPFPYTERCTITNLSVSER